MKELVLKVEGMHCTGCENRVKNALETIEGIEEVKADHTLGEVVVSVSKEVSMDEIKSVIEDLGFEVKE